MNESGHRDDPRDRAAGRGLRHVFVDGLELMASVGVFEVEHRYEQRILVSVGLEVLDDYDGTSDRLDQVLDYGTIVEACRRIVDRAHYNLIETLAERIADAVLLDARVHCVRIRIEKPDIVAGCRAVGIGIERRRGGGSG
ncbi:MAG: dihydroneopterin aldolase [Hyphomicrobiaceae bacterium]|nr:dihydroneopterin aldolase [Hyphomicrobiaceae bacterium]